MNSISVKECLAFGWRTFKARPWFFVIITLITFAISFLSGFVQGLVGDTFGEMVGGSISFLIALFADTFIAMGIIVLYLKAHDSVQGASFKDFWSFRYFWAFLATSLLVSILTVLGLILLIVPGLIIMTMLCFSTVLVVDRNRGPIAAMKESRRITKGHRWVIFRLLVVMVVLNIVGALALLVGLLVSGPVTILAMVHAYRQISGTGVVAPVASAEVFE